MSSHQYIFEAPGKRSSRLPWVWKSSAPFTISAETEELPALEKHNNDKDRTGNSHKHHRDSNGFPYCFIPSCQDPACEKEHRKSGGGACYSEEYLASECESQAWSHLVERDIPGMAIPSIAKFGNKGDSHEGCCWNLISKLDKRHGSVDDLYHCNQDRNIIGSEAP